MADETEIPTEIKDSPHFATLRRKLEATEAELATIRTTNEGLRGQLIRNAVELAGFKSDAEGKYEVPAVALLVKEFANSLTDDLLPTKDAFLELAGQYGVTPAAEASAPVAEPTLAEQIAAMQAGAAPLQQAGQPPAPVDPNDLDAQIQAAQAAGNVALSLSLQMKKAEQSAA